jgi:hypothetical protein
MADYKKVLQEFEQEKSNNIKNGKVKDYDLTNRQLADRIIEENWDKSDIKWKKEYAQEIIKNRKENE